jgi:quinolinate synthase
MGGLTESEIRSAKMILWRGHCSVHGRFNRQSIDDFRNRIPEIQIIVHPECQHEVVTAADVVGSTEKIIQTVTNSAPGTQWAVGTELNLVGRLAAMNPDKKVYFLDRTVCYCSTMNRIDLPHLVWALESLVNGQVVNQIKVDPETARYSKVALEQMLAL